MPGSAVEKAVLEREPPDTSCGIDIEKYTVLGNTFLIVAELETPALPEAWRAAFARGALDGYRGVGGADNVLFVGRTFRGDGQVRYTMRVFEHDGSETLSCGNGLLATACLLSGRCDGSTWTVLTELP